MDFFREKKKAYEHLEDYLDNDKMYFWNLEDGFQAALLIFKIS